MLRRILVVPKKLPCKFLSINCFSSSNSKNLKGEIGNDIKLRADVKKLGATLGNIIKNKDGELFESIEKLRLLGRDWRTPNGNSQSFQEMVDEVKKYSPKRLLGISRAFTHFLALSNAAENHHRIRRLREVILESNSESSLYPKEDSAYGSIYNMINKSDVDKKDIFNALCNQQVEIVLTAHPTEVNRRTILQKHQNINHILTDNDRLDLLNYEKRELNTRLQREILSIWESDELRRSKPTPIDEAKVGLAIIENVLWQAVPNYIRKLNDVSVSLLGQSLPHNIAPIKIASWMGGDRDGNPNVTPEITREVSLLSRWLSATLFRKDIQKLREELSVKQATPSFLKLSGDVREPYREVLLTLRNRLDATIDWSNSLITGTARKSAEPPITHSKELIEPLLAIYNSLVECGFEQLADGLLIDTIRRVAAFGVSLIQVDLRQESNRHTEALDAITQYLGIGSYKSWSETERRKWLQQELASKRPLLPRRRKLDALNFSPTVKDTLATFELASLIGDGSLGAYVISQCQQASDILAVMLLQQDAGVTPELRVVPLFETLDDLERSHHVIEALFSMPEYVSRINGHQEIMVGYSDSAKDAGRLAAAWAQYIAQEKMIKVAQTKDIQLTFFHGKGGTIGRGGNPAVYRAILAHPPNTINGRFRVTEQGEMITQNFGHISIAERTLDLFTAGVLSERFVKRPEPKIEWRQAMEQLSATSCKAYRSVVREDKRFVPYFRNATPELELAGLNVGSRPAKRNPTGGVESLRAIPWVFAWTQTRLNLPAWLGVGEGLDEIMQKQPKLLMEMYNEWPWFNTLIDLLEMILAKSESKIAQNYDNQLVKDKTSIELGDELRRKFQLTQKCIVAITGNETIGAHNPRLMASMNVRNPYIDPLNVIQAELLLRLRNKPNDGSNNDLDELKILQDALLITINGIANGMRNSG